MAKLLDPIGLLFIVTELSLSWTAIEKSTRLIALEGTVLSNRLLWLAIALGALAFTHLRFHFSYRTATTWWNRITRRRDAHSLTSGHTAIASRAISSPKVGRTFGFAMQVRQTLAIAWTSFREIAKSWAGLALLAVTPILVILILPGEMALNGVPLVPTTARVIDFLTAPLTAVQTHPAARAV